ncbi:MAG: LysR family transcriptional regulator [Methyloceanibacter sp.]|nr:LysR family transcriptional regulator [Methyloceanibacter sp.]
MHLREIDANLLVTLDALLVDASVTRAAERLGRSASAISHSLAKLREIFADELFVRAGQRLVPTAKALELAPTVHVILAGMESLLRPAKPFDPASAARDFAIASGEAGELVLVQPLRRRIEHVAPSIRVDWTPGYAADAFEALRQGHSHFLIDIEGTPIPAPDIRVTRLFDDTLVTLAKPEHKFAARKPNAAAFATAAHIEVDSLPALPLLDGALATHGETARIASRVSSVLVGLLLVLNSDFLLTIPSSLAAILEKEFNLIRIAQPFEAVTMPARLLWHSSYDRDECHQWVRDELVRLAREIELTG